MTRGHPDAPPTWFRLSEESWAEIRDAYRNGATARELAARWRVSPTSIYRHACVGGWTKKASADALARTHAAQIGAEEAADEAALTPPPEPVAPTPCAMRQHALREMSRALAAGRYSEAQTLVRLVQSLGQLALAEEDSDEADEGRDESRPATGDDAAAINYLAARLSELKAETMWPQIRKFAEEMLRDRLNPPSVFSRAFFRWRAEQFGPEQAQADRQAVLHSPHYETLYDAEGRVRDGWGRQTDYLPKPEGFDAFEAKLRATQARLEAEASDGRDGD